MALSNLYLDKAQVQFLFVRDDHWASDVTQGLFHDVAERVRALLSGTDPQ